MYNIDMNKKWEIMNRHWLTRPAGLETVYFSTVNRRRINNFEFLKSIVIMSPNYYLFDILNPMKVYFK